MEAGDGGETMMGENEPCQILSVWAVLVVFGWTSSSTDAGIGGADTAIPWRAAESARCVQ